MSIQNDYYVIQIYLQVNYMGDVNWSEEIREFIKKKIKEHKKRKALQEVVAYIQTLPEALKGTAQKLVREDRDSH